MGCVKKAEILIIWFPEGDKPTHENQVNIFFLADALLSL